MSNAYLNNILFGNSASNINREYVESLISHMYTEDWMSAHHSFESKDVSVNGAFEKPNESVIPVSSGLIEVKGNSTKKIEDQSSQPADTVQQHKFPKKQINKNTLFWSIYEHERPGEAFLNPYSANVEIDTRIQVVDKLKKNPKILKETNSKLTLEETQGLFGSMLTAREDKLEFCVAYSAFYNKHILVVYPRTYRIFSPTVSAEIEDDDHVIILHASKERGTVVFKAEQNTTKAMADSIMREKVAKLRAQSHYKIPELEAIALRMGTETKTSEGKRRKKEDVYNDILLAIHNDVNFVEN